MRFLKLILSILLSRLIFNIFVNICIRASSSVNPTKIEPTESTLITLYTNYRQHKCNNFENFFECIIFFQIPINTLNKFY